MKKLFMFTVILLFFSCGSDDDGFVCRLPCPDCPYLTGASRQQDVGIGDTLLLYGGNLGGFGTGLLDGVYLGVTELLVIAVSDTTLLVEIPFNARTGLLTVCAGRSNKYIEGTPPTLCSDEDCVMEDYPPVVITISCPPSQETPYSSVLSPSTDHSSVDISAQLQNGSIVVLGIEPENDRNLRLHLFDRFGQIDEEMPVMINNDESLKCLVGVTAREDGGFTAVAEMVSGGHLLLAFDASGEVAFVRNFGMPQFDISEIRATTGGYLLTGTTTAFESVEAFIVKLNTSGSIISDFYSGDIPGIPLQPVLPASTNSEIYGRHVFERGNGDLYVVANQIVRSPIVRRTIVVFNIRILSDGMSVTSTMITEPSLRAGVVAIHPMAGGGHILLCGRYSSIAEVEKVDEYVTIVLNEQADVAGSPVVIEKTVEQEHLTSIIELASENGGFLVGGHTTRNTALQTLGILLIKLNPNREETPGRRRSFNRFDNEQRDVEISALYQSTENSFSVIGTINWDGNHRVYHAYTDCI